MLAGDLKKVLKSNIALTTKEFSAYTDSPHVSSHVNLMNLANLIKQEVHGSGGKPTKRAIALQKVKPRKATEYTRTLWDYYILRHKRDNNNLFPSDNIGKTHGLFFYMAQRYTLAQSAAFIDCFFTRLDDDTSFILKSGRSVGKMYSLIPEMIIGYPHYLSERTYHHQAIIEQHNVLAL